jgi:16S rRNA (cytidine1402-2'-O)-methyltransferase
VATPIGNAADITLRALATLRTAAAIACEDTRTTAKLLAIHGISRPLIAYHEHNAAAAGAAILARLEGGEAVALVSDAGTPLVSDPGYRLVRRCIDAGLPVIAVPGASSVLAALSVSGLPTDRFLFAGFPPPRQAARRRFLAGLAGAASTLVLMESPQRLAMSLADMVEVLGDREAAVCRELTKLFEEVRRGPLADLAAHYHEAGPPKGEVTLVIAPPAPAAGLSDGELDALIGDALEAGESVRSAADRIAAASGRPRRDVYARALGLRRDRSGGA